MSRYRPPDPSRTRNRVRTILGCSGVAVVLGAVGVALPHWPNLIVVGVGVVLYATGAFVISPASQEEKRLDQAAQHLTAADRAWLVEQNRWST